MHLGDVLGHEFMGIVKDIGTDVKDVNLLPVPDSVTDEQVVMLSDIALWGCGPVGLIVIMWAKYRGVKRINASGNAPKRLDKARELGAETINYNEKQAIPTMLEICKGGPDVCIDATGFRYAKEVIHKVERVLRLETDATSAITEAILIKVLHFVQVLYVYKNLEIIVEVYCDR
jgi:threonine dehydrogenase-like Zn-dependent dehydrogenase